MKRNTLQAVRLHLLLGVALVCATCAREEMPPGTGPDFEAPQVVEMFPAPATAVPDLDEDVYVRFDEPIADPRSVARTLETSPAWLYEVNAGRRNVRIRPVDGWRPGVVYSFRIPPGLADLVRNRTRSPIEFLFTTGSQFYDTRTVGEVWHRETVRKVRDIAIQVLGADSIPYAAVTDTGGNFALRGLPVGAYWAFAFRDQNRNRTLERDFEPHDSGHVALDDSASVVRLELWLTMPDSTPPALGLAEVRDSLNVRLNFDDLLDPEASLEQASVRVTQAESGVE
ncbi:MAG: Ig-like domain-containing protein, partial [Gemmatimonadetes bacterium]|nr:Ig-like domain-containing protein [Gemmatimonadota bacterium]